MKRLFLAITAVAIAGCAAPPAGELLPADFAYGQSFDAPSGAPFVRLFLPDTAFNQTAWPDMRDIRVFNAAAESLPFARMAPQATTAAARRITLRSFQVAESNPGRLPQVQLDAGERGVQMRVVPGTPADAGALYMLATQESDAQSQIERLVLNWADATRNWQQNVTVSVSQDLQTWSTVAFRRPIMDLHTTDGEQLSQREVTIDSSGYYGRYWRLQFAPGFMPALTSVEAELVPEVVLPPGVALPAGTDPQQDGSVIYRLTGVHPIARLRFLPSNPNSVFPVRIEGRRDDKDKWQTIASSVLYRLNSDAGEQISDPVRLGGAPFNSFRVKAIGTSWGAAPPTLTAERDAVVLVVNTRGSGPFLLAWGSRPASDSSVGLATLVPGGSEAIAKLPDARLGSDQQLGGPDRLTAVAPAERAAQWQTILVWVALIGGAVGLGFLALRLLRETRAAQ